MATERSAGPPGSGKGGDPPDDAFFARFRAAGVDPRDVVSLVGILQAGPREGYSTLFLSLDLARSLEIRTADIVSAEALGNDASPFGERGGTRVWVRRDAKLSYAETQRLDAANFGDEFDLDVRLGGGLGPGGFGPEGFPTGGLPEQWPPITLETCFDTACGGRCVELPPPTVLTCRTCRTCHRTCFTCRPTCFATCQGTCGNTCRPTCGPTCVATCQGTCSPTCRGTCGNTCQRTCFDGCVTFAQTHCNTCWCDTRNCV